MLFTARVICENAAFDPDPAPELARILRELAKRIEAGERYGRLQDGNGNTVARFELG